MQTANGRYWFCRIAPLGRDPALGYLLVAQDWTEVQEDLNRRVASSIGAGGIVVVLTAILIPLVARKYVSLPLAELSRRVSSFSSGDEPERELAGDEVTLITEEFRRLDRELTVARRRLLDESERKLELERRLRHSDKLATIGTLASGLAHEIGTPMGVIRGRAEHLLRSNPDPGKLNQGLEIIINQIDRISRIVRMLLDFGRRREPVRVTTDVRAIVQRTLHLLETEAERRNISLVSELGAVPLLVDCDADQLQQVFVNLGMNALDAMAERRRHAAGQRRAAHGPRTATQVRLCFEDNGPGVDEQFKERVFDPFFTTKDPGKGTGMGLAVSQSIVRDHEGEITLEPRRARSALRGVPGRVPSGSRSDSRRAPEMENERSTILVVDDDREMANILVEILRRGRLPRDRRQLRSDALALVRRDHLDLVISDLRMVGMSGHQLQAEIKRLVPNLPVLIITAFGSIQTAVESMKLGAVRLHHQALQQRRADAGGGARAGGPQSAPGNQTAAR